MGTFIYKFKYLETTIIDSNNVKIELVNGRLAETLVFILFASYWHPDCFLGLQN